MWDQIYSLKGKKKQFTQYVIWLIIGRPKAISVCGSSLPRTHPLICAIIRVSLQPGRHKIYKMGNAMWGGKCKGGGHCTETAPLDTTLSLEWCKYTFWKLTQPERKHPTGCINTQQRIMGILFQQLCPALWTLAPVGRSNQCWSMGSSPHSSIHTMIISWKESSGTPCCQMVSFPFQMQANNVSPKSLAPFFVISLISPMLCLLGGDIQKESSTRRREKIGYSASFRVLLLGLRSVLIGIHQLYSIKTKKNHILESIFCIWLLCTHNNYQ